MFKLENILNVNINDVCANSWNPKNKRTKEYEKVKESVKKQGLLSPLIVREIDDEIYKYEILDGEQKLTACLDLEYKEVPVYNLGKIDDNKAKQITIYMMQHVDADKKQLGELLVELVDKVELPYTDEEIEVISGISLNEDEDEEFVDVGNGMEKFSILIPLVHLEKLKSEISKIKKEYDTNDGVSIMIILDAYLNGKRNENVFSLIERLNQEEIES